MSFERIPNHLGQMLRTPWLAASRATCWIAVTVCALCLVAVAVAAWFGKSSAQWEFDALVVGVGNAFCWVLVMPNNLLMALDARRLCLPGVRREVVRSLLLYACLTVGVPTLLLWPAGHGLAFVIVLLLCAGGGMLYALLPGYWAVALCLLPALHGATRHWVALPGPRNQNFVLWGGVAAVLVVLTCVLRWRQLLSSDAAALPGLRAPMALRFRRIVLASQRDPLTSAAAIRERPDWQILRPDLRRVGPDAAVKSIRVMLGGLYLPQTMLGRVYRWALGFGVFVALVLVSVLSTMNGSSGMQLLRGIWDFEGVLALGVLFGGAGIGVVLMALGVLDLRWSKAGAELSLLAMLPGLGGQRQVRRTVLKAVLGPPMGWLGLLLVVVLVVVVWLHLSVVPALVALLAPVGCFGVLLAVVLNTLGGRSLRSWRWGLLWGAVCSLVVTSVTLPLGGADLLNIAPVLWSGMLLAWAVLALGLLWLGRCGWQASQQRPHLFLPNES